MITRKHSDVFSRSLWSPMQPTSLQCMHILSQHGNTIARMFLFIVAINDLPDSPQGVFAQLVSQETAMIQSHRITA